eukprot:COSAG02_NODE_190_length_30025_cov_22.989875_36_plen_217_part_00
MHHLLEFSPCRRPRSRCVTLPFYPKKRNSWRSGSQRPGRHCSTLSRTETACIDKLSLAFPVCFLCKRLHPRSACINLPPRVRLDRYYTSFAASGWGVLVEGMPLPYRASGVGTCEAQNDALHFVLAAEAVRTIIPFTARLCDFRPGVAVAVRWLGAFGVAMSFSWLDSWQVWVFFTVEASIVGVAVLFACWALGETRGRSLEHVRQYACFHYFHIG